MALRKEIRAVTANACKWTLENTREFSRSSRLRYGWSTVNNKRGGGKCVIWTCCSCGKMRKMANFVSEKVVSFDSAFEEALKCLLECSMSCALKSKQNEVISSTLVLERIYWPWCQLALGKAWYFGYWLAGKNPSSVVVVCQVMIKWINGLTVATLTAFRLEDIDCEKYQLVFAQRTFWWGLYFTLIKITQITYLW